MSAPPTKPMVPVFVVLAAIHPTRNEPSQSFVTVETTFGAIGGERSSGEASMYARMDELGVSTVLEDGACAWGERDPAAAAGESSVAAADDGGLEDVGWDRDEVGGRSYMSICTNNQ